MDSQHADRLHVDCDRCAARGPACRDCVITVLLGPVEETVDLDTDEQAALAALADSGLVPPLRLVPGAQRASPQPAPRTYQGYAWEDHA
jgi:hypothetical protein